MTDIYAIRLGPCAECGESPCRCAQKEVGPAIASEAVPALPVSAMGDVTQPTRIPPEALAAVERVLAHRAAAVAEVPGQERWRSTTVDHQTAKALSHAAEAAIGTERDRDTGEHPLAHAAARALLGLALALRGKP